MEHLLRKELYRDYCNGRLLERQFYQQTRKHIHDMKRILHEIELRRLFGWHACSIDFLIEFDEGFVAVQCKYRNTRRRENNGVDNFIKSVELIKHKYGKPFLFGLWVSRLEPFDDNINRLLLHNIQIVASETIQGLVSTSIERIYNNIRCML